jgi:hypothetical protein
MPSLLYNARHGEETNSNKEKEEQEDEDSDSGKDLMPPPLLPIMYDWDGDHKSMIEDCEEKSVNTATMEEAFQVVNYDHKRDMEE